MHSHSGGSWIRLAGSSDPALQAYVLRNLTLADRDAVQKNLRGILELLRGFEPSAAVAVLHDFDGRAVPGLGKLLLHLLWEDSRPEVQAPALHILGRQDERDELLPELLRLRRHLLAPRALSALVSVLGRVGKDLPFKLFKPYLSHPDARVRANTVETLLERLHPRLTEVFAVLVNDPSPRVRSLSALALWRLGKPVLASLLEETEDSAERACVAYAAGKAGQDPRLATGLFALASDEKLPPGVRGMAARSLASAASSADIGRLVGLAFRADRAQLRRTLVESACTLDSAGTSSYLARVLTRLEPTMRVRQISSTISLMGMLSVRPEPQLLAPYLEHPDCRVAANAAEVLGRQAESTPVAAALGRAIHNPHGRVAANAALALWRQGFVGAFARFRELARDGRAAARASAAWALGQAGGLLAQDTARPLLDDIDEGVRRWAFEALR